jgi:hypothetical protein
VKCGFTLFWFDRKAVRECERGGRLCGVDGQDADIEEAERRNIMLSLGWKARKEGGWYDEVSAVLKIL